MRAMVSGCLLFLTVCVLTAAGQSIPKREDMPKYIATVTNQSASPKDRAQAATMIGRRGAINVRDVVEGVEPLRRAAKDKDAVVRASAVEALGSIAPEPTTTVPLLIEILKTDQSPQVKYSTAIALGRFGPAAKAALPAIRDFSKGLDKKQAKAIKEATSAISGK